MEFRTRGLLLICVIVVLLKTCLGQSNDDIGSGDSTKSQQSSSHNANNNDKADGGTMRNDEYYEDEQSSKSSVVRNSFWQPSDVDSGEIVHPPSHTEMNSRTNSPTQTQNEDVRGNPRDPIIEVGEMVMDLEEKGSSTPPPSSSSRGGKHPKSRPNIILIMTDDQDIELGSMEYMPETLKIFRDNGMEFRHGYVTTPMCCPSRSSILTGLYIHNHNIYTNNDNCSSIGWREKYEKKTFGAHLWSSGYYTGYIGKYLNKYDGSHVPYGWDEWKGLLMNSRFYNYSVNVNGRKYRHGSKYEDDYYPDVIANDTIEFLTRVGSSPRKQPFLLVSSFPSPHGPEDSAPQYSNLFFNDTPHHTPNYNHAPNNDKQWILRQTNKMTPLLKDFTNMLMTKRLQTLQSVDVAMKRIMDTLKEYSLVENTFVFYTSDHGYHVGQFGLVKGKSMPYEFDIRVPFFVHGPSSRVKKRSTVLEPVLNIDLAPTFLHLANIPVPEDMDGRSFLPLIQKYSSKGSEDNQSFLPMTSSWRHVFLIESSGRREASSMGTQSSSEANGDGKGLKRRRFEERHETAARLQNLCLLHPHPCRSGQRRYCRKDEFGTQFKKCRKLDFFIEDFSQMNDPLYHIVSTNSSSHLPSAFTPRSRCSCSNNRYKRGVEAETEDDDLNWSSERKKIDEEIELLKRRIDELRFRRRTMRRKWLTYAVPPSSTTTQSPELDRDGEDSSSQRRRKGKGGRDKGVDTEEVTLSPRNPTIQSTSRDFVSIDSEEEEEDDEDEEEDEDEDDEDEDEDEEDEEEDEEGSVAPSTTTTTTTTTSTTSTSPPPPAHSKPTQRNRKSGFSPRTKDNFQSRNGTRSKSVFYRDRTVHDPGFRELESFVRQKQSGNKSRHRNRQRQHHKLNKHGKGKKPWIDRTGKSEDPKEEGEDAITYTEGVPPVCDCDVVDDPKWLRQKEREERKRRKLLSKLRKKQKYMKRIGDPTLRQQAETCGSEERMNCFWHDKDHWKTPPLWNSDSFCFCMNSNNNTYSCLRSINATHNYLYCQFVTGFKMYFDLRRDPYQLRNIIDSLPESDEEWMLMQLLKLKKCKGREECGGELEEGHEVGHRHQSSIWEQVFGKWPRKKRRGHRRRNNSSNLSTSTYKPYSIGTE